MGDRLATRTGDEADAARRVAGLRVLLLACSALAAFVAGMVATGVALARMSAAWMSYGALMLTATSALSLLSLVVACGDDDAATLRDGDGTPAAVGRRPWPLRRGRWVSPPSSPASRVADASETVAGGCAAVAGAMLALAGAGAGDPLRIAVGLATLLAPAALAKARDAAGAAIRTAPRLRRADVAAEAATGDAALGDAGATGPGAAVGGEETRGRAMRLRTPLGEPVDAIGAGDPTAPVPPGHRRVAIAYDDLVPVAWADVPCGAADPMPTYLSSQAAEAMMGDGEAEAEGARSQVERAPRDAGTEHWVAPALVLSAATTGVWVLAGLVPEIRAMPAWRVILVDLIALVATLAWPCGDQGAGHALPGCAPASPPGDDGALALRLDGHRGAPGVGRLADEARRQLDEARARGAEIDALLADRFGRDGLTYARFRAVAGMAEAAVRGNAEAIADGLDRIRARGAATPGQGDADASVAGHLRDSEELLGEMGRLADGLSALGGRDASDGSAEALGEMRRLIDDLPGYDGTL